MDLSAGDRDQRAMVLGRRDARAVAVVGGWCLLAVAAALGAVAGRPGVPAIARPAGILLGVAGAAVACLGAAVDARPVVLDDRLVARSPTQRRLLKTAGVTLAAAVPIGAAASLVAGGLLGVYLTLAVVTVALVLVGTALGRALTSAVRARFDSGADSAADADTDSESGRDRSDAVDDRTRARRRHERR